MGLCFYNIVFIFSFDKKYKEKFIYSGEIKIISIKKENKYYKSYLAKDIKNKNKFIIYIKKGRDYIPGDILEITGEFNKAEEDRNYKGFNYRKYLKQYKVYGIIQAKEAKYKCTAKDLYWIIGKARKEIYNKIERLYSKKSSAFLKTILLGDNNIENDTVEIFRKSSISHILAISGMHITYISLAIKKFISIFIKSKKKQNVCQILFLIFFAFFIGENPSCIRACIMHILAILSEFFYRKSNFYINILAALLILLFINPFNIYSIGMWLSFFGTLGIVMFSDLIKKLISKKIYISKIILEPLVISISAQIMILPIIAYSFSKISLSFFIPNILISYFIGPIVIFGYISIILSFLNMNYIVTFEEFLINIAIKIATICSKIPFSEIYIKTPYAVTIILIYTFIFICAYKFQKRKIYYMKKILSFRISVNLLNKVIVSILLFLLISNINLNCNLKINFIDVGQGDCCLIRTSSNKTIIIDGGEDLDGKILLPYLLDRRIKKIDYIMISHFDSDHSLGFNKVLENIKVSNIILSEQIEQNDIYNQILEIAKSKNINLIYVRAGNSLNIDNMKIIILHPQNELIAENAINNNSIVCKIEYCDFSMLFTGDIEKEAEERIVSIYKDTNILNADILKVAHHRI